MAQNQIQHCRSRLLVGLSQVETNSVLSAQVMKVAAYSIFGALIGLCATAASVYFAGLVVDALGFTLFHSEADQQRNFNIALIFVVVFTGLGDDA
jgi:uncharacterized membrane protein YedE/YeeE